MARRPNSEQIRMAIAARMELIRGCDDRKYLPGVLCSSDSHIRRSCRWDEHVHAHLAGSLYLYIEFVQPLLSIHVYCRESADALSKEDIGRADIGGKVIFFHCSAQFAIHFNVSDHTARHGTSLL